MRGFAVFFVSGKNTLVHTYKYTFYCTTPPQITVLHTSMVANLSKRLSSSHYMIAQDGADN